MTKRLSRSACFWIMRERTGDEKFTSLLTAQARKFFMADQNCPLAYEPSGEDFLSPCLGEADAMRRVLRAERVC